MLRLALNNGNTLKTPLVIERFLNCSDRRLSSDPPIRTRQLHNAKLAPRTKAWRLGRDVGNSEAAG